MMRYLCWISLLLLTACSNSAQHPDEPIDLTASNTGELDTPRVSKAEDKATVGGVSTSVNEQIHNARNNDLRQSATGTTTPQTDDVIKEAALQFAHDISQNNQAVLARVRQAFDNPSRDPATVGFALSEDVSDFEVAFRTAVTALSESNYVLAYENKYANELLSSMATNQTIFPAGAELNPQIEQYIEQLSYGIELGPDDFELDEPIFAEAVNTLEKNANANGVYFLELNLGSIQQELAVERLTWATIWDDIAYNIYDTDTYNLPGILEYQKPVYRDARSLINR